MLEPNRLRITEEEMDWAFNTLKSNKAIGVDGLPDFVLKNKERRELLKARLTPVFEEWLNGKPLPAYLKTTRVVTLSKEDGEQYPAHGKIRTIAVAPAITKLYEKVIHQKLWVEINERGLISDNQNAYKKGRSTLNNLERTIIQMKDIHKKMKGIPAKKRPNYYKVNIDAARAFDGMRRDRIVEMLLEKNVNARLANAIRLTLEETQM
jgi:hypothetical protein